MPPGSSLSESGGSDVKGGNFVQIATVDALNRPRVRTVVFRGFLDQKRITSKPKRRARPERSALMLATDMRSDKVEEGGAARTLPPPPPDHPTQVSHPSQYPRSLSGREGPHQKKTVVRRLSFWGGGVLRGCGQRSVQTNKQTNKQDADTTLGLPTGPKRCQGER